MNQSWYSHGMIYFAFLLNIVLAHPGSAEEFYDTRQVSLIRGEMGDLRIQSQKATASIEPLNEIFRKVTREGIPGETEDGKAVILDGNNQGEHLRVSAVFAAPPIDAGEKVTKLTDLVLRFTHIIAEREKVTSEGSYTRIERWVYRVFFDGVMGPVVHQVIYPRNGS